MEDWYNTLEEHTEEYIKYLDTIFGVSGWRKDPHGGFFIVLEGLYFRAWTNSKNNEVEIYFQGSTKNRYPMPLIYKGNSYLNFKELYSKVDSKKDNLESLEEIKIPTIENKDEDTNLHGN